MLGLEYQVFAVTSVHRKRCYAFSDIEAQYLRADGIYDTGNLISRNKGYLRRVDIGAGQHDQLGRADAGRAHTDSQLPQTGQLKGPLDTLQDLGSSGLRQHHGPIGCCRIHRANMRLWGGLGVDFDPCATGADDWPICGIGTLDLSPCRWLAPASAVAASI